MATLSATLQAAISAYVTHTAAERPGQANLVDSYTQFNQKKVLNASSTPPGTKLFADTFSGNQSLDLTALADPEQGTVDGTGLKVQAILVAVNTAHDVTISDAAGTPYSLNGTSDIVVEGSGWVLMYFADGLADIAAGAKDIEIVTSSTDYDVLIIMG